MSSYMTASAVGTAMSSKISAPVRMTFSPPEHGRLGYGACDDEKGENLVIILGMHMQLSVKHCIDTLGEDSISKTVQRSVRRSGGGIQYISV